jgi:hypothetical protein
MEDGEDEEGYGDFDECQFKAAQRVPATADLDNGPRLLTIGV